MPSPDPGELLELLFTVLVSHSSKGSSFSGVCSNANLEFPRNPLQEPQNVQVLIVGDLVSNLKMYAF